MFNSTPQINSMTHMNLSSPVHPKPTFYETCTVWQAKVSLPY